MNRCLHCAIMDALVDWGTEYGEGREGTERFTTLEQGRQALAMCLGEIIATTLPGNDLENVASRIHHIAQASREITAAFVAADERLAAGGSSTGGEMAGMNDNATKH